MSENKCIIDPELHRRINLIGNILVGGALVGGAVSLYGVYTGDELLRNVGFLLYSTLMIVFFGFCGKIPDFLLPEKFRGEET